MDHSSKLNLKAKSNIKQLSFHPKISNIKHTIDWKVNQLLKRKSGIFHNRATLLSAVWIIVSWIVGYSSFPYPFESVKGEELILFGVSMIMSINTYIITDGWEETRTNYLRFIRILEQHGIDEESFLKYMDDYEEGIIIWYCQLQGIYLAMKEYWLEQEFFEMKSLLTDNKIPNF